MKMHQNESMKQQQLLDILLVAGYGRNPAKCNLKVSGLASFGETFGITIPVESLLCICGHCKQYLNNMFNSGQGLGDC